MFENITFSLSKGKQRLMWCFECELACGRNRDVFNSAASLACGRKTWWLWILLLQYYCAVEREHVMCFEFYYNILACKRKNLMLWMNATSLLFRQRKRDVFDKTPMFFFLFQKSTFVINENNITQNWNMDFFFWFFIIYQLKIWWCFWRDRFGKRDVFIVILWKNAIFLVSEFEQKIKFVLFWRKSQSFRKVFRRKCDDFYCKTRDGFDTAICVFPFKTLPFYHKF